MKRALAIFMALAMMTSALPVTAMAEDTSQTLETTTGTEKAVQSSMKINVDEIVEVEEDGTVTLQDVELTAVGTDFAVGETLTMTLSSGFGFDEEGEEDSGLADIQIVGDKLELTFTAATNKCNISNMEIDALTAPVGAVASLTITGSNRGEATTDVAVVVEEGKTVCFEVDSNDIVVNGKKVTIDRPDPAIWEDKEGNVMIAMRAASQILQKLDRNMQVTWDATAEVATYIIGNKTVELTVGSDIAVVNGNNEVMETACIWQNYGTGGYVCFPMADFFEALGAKDWAVLKGEGGFNLQIVAPNPYMTLDIPELEILVGGTVSYDTFGVDTVGRDFEIGEIVTLEISNGFEFVESPIHDHDKTVLQDVVWSANKVKVPVYKTYDSGFDMEGMTIKATTAKVGDEALLTVSAVNYPDVSRVIATVVNQLTPPAPQQNGCGIDVDKVVKVEEEGTVTLGDVTLEADGADFTAGETLTLTITPGFAFVDYAKTDSAQADIVSIASDKIVLTPDQTTPDIVIENIKIEAVTAVAGNTAKLTVSGDQRTGDSIKVASVIAKPAFELKIKDDVELPAGWGTDLETLSITKTKGVFKEGDVITFSLNNSKYFSFDQIEVENEKLNITPGDTTGTYTVPQKLDGEDELLVTEWTVKVDENARVNTEAVVSVTIGNHTEKITVGTVVDYSMTGKFDGATVTSSNLVAVQNYGVLTQTPAPGILIEIDEVDYRYVESGVTPKAVLEIELNDATLNNFDLDKDGIVDANEWAELENLIKIGNSNVTAVLESVDDWETLEFWIYGRLNDGDEITVELPANFYQGTEAEATVRGDIIEVGHARFAVLRKDVMTVTAQPKNIAKYGRVYLSDIIINCGAEEFSKGEKLRLDLDEVNGFTFDESRKGKIKVTNAKVSMFTDDELSLTLTDDVNQVVLTDVVLLSDDTVALGDEAILNVSYAGFKDKATVVAVVVQDSLVLDVNPKTVRKGGTATYDVFGIDKTAGGRFKDADEVTLTLNDGFEFVEGPIYDHNGTVIQVKEWTSNKVVVYAPNNPEHGFDMESMMICATSAKAGDVATVTASVAGYDPVSRDVLTVVKSSSGGGGGSSKKSSAPATTPTPAVPPVTAEETTTVNGQTSTVDTTAQTVQPVSQVEKEIYQAQLKDAVPAATAVGDGAYTFAVAADNSAADNTSSGTKDPEKISFDLSGQNVADPSHLTLVKYVTQPDGTVEVVKLGGTFDSVTNTFSAYADGEGVYDLVHDPDVTKITFAIGQTDVSVNDTVKTNDVAPMLYNDKTMIPLRSIAEALGATVTWDELSKTVVMELDGQRLVLTVDGDTAMIHNDRTMVQLRYIGENFGAGVRWIPSTRSIEIVK